jgi:hypothetical protein
MKIGWTVDIPKHAGVRAGHFRDRCGAQQMARALVAFEATEIGAECVAEPDWMTVASDIDRTGDGGTALQRRSHRRDGFRSYPGHIAERDQPTVCVSRRRNAAGNAMAHASGSSRADGNIEALRRKSLCYVVRFPDHGEHMRQRGAQGTGRRNDHRRPIGEEGTALIAAEAAAAAGGEQDADGHSTTPR